MFLRTPASIHEQPPTPANAADLPFHDGVLIDSGRIIYRSGLNPGRIVKGRRKVQGFGRDLTLDRTGLFPKSNRMTHPSHSVKVETQVMQGI